MTDATGMGGSALPPGLSERLFTALLRSSSEGLILSRFDDTVMLEVSEAFVDLTGYARDELIGRPSTDLGLVPPAAREQTIASLGEHGSLRRVATELRTKTGEIRNVEFSSDVLRDGEQAYVLSTLRDITERVRAERELRLSRDRFLQIFDASPVPTLIGRLADGLVVLANPACLEILGWEASEFVGRTTAELNFWPEPEGRRTMMDEVLAHGRVRGYEAPIRKRNGEILNMLASVEPLELDGEQCLLGLFYDITERKHVEESVRVAEERYRDLFENAAGAIFHATLEGELMEVNHAFASLLGYESPEQLKAEAENVHAVYDDPHERERLLDAMRENGIVKGFELLLRRRPGDTVWVTLDVSPVVDAAGRVVELREAATDITVRKRVKEALRESEQRFRLLAENSTDVISRHSPDGTLLYLSPACLRLFGYEPEEMVGRQRSEFLHPDDRRALEDRRTRESLTVTDTQTLAFRQLHKDGNYVWVEAAVHGVRDAETGELMEFQASTRDIGDRVRADEVIKRAKERAEQANEAKSRFFAHISHELRTPLAAILGFAELLERSDAVADDKARQWLEYIRQGGRHLHELVNQLLEIARIEGGNLPLVVVSVDAVASLRDVVGLTAPLAAERGIRIEHESTSDTDRFVLADGLRLKQVLLNLLSNAIKYNRPAGLVSVSAEPTERGTIRIAVSDTGEGIAPEQLKRLFNPFERLGAEAGPVEGTGLGLVIAKGLAEAMYGALEVQSEVGKGTTFVLELPRVEAVATQFEPAVVSPFIARRSTGGNVLYVEDNPVNVELVRSILTDLRPSLELRTASEGELGVRLAQEHRPDLLLLDLNLPDISGEDVLLRLRAQPETADVPVLILSADSVSRNVTRLLQTGADAYLTKPLDVKQFLDVLDRLLANR